MFTKAAVGSGVCVVVFAALWLGSAGLAAESGTQDQRSELATHQQGEQATRQQPGAVSKSVPVAKRARVTVGEVTLLGPKFSAKVNLTPTGISASVIDDVDGGSHPAIAVLDKENGYPFGSEGVGAILAVEGGSLLILGNVEGEAGVVVKTQLRRFETTAGAGVVWGFTPPAPCVTCPRLLDTTALAEVPLRPSRFAAVSPLGYVVVFDAGTCELIEEKGDPIKVEGLESASSVIGAVPESGSGFDLIVTGEDVEDVRGFLHFSPEARLKSSTVHTPSGWVRK